MRVIPQIFLWIGIEEYDDANDDTMKNRDSNLNTKDEKQHDQRRSNASHSQDHKRRRHGKSKKKGGEEVDKSLNETTESRISDAGESQREDTANGNIRNQNIRYQTVLK